MNSGMNVQWSMLQNAEKNDQLNYSIYRCIEPTAVKTGEPWFPDSNVCPCDPNLSNSSGRGFTAFPIGIAVEKASAPLSQGQLHHQIPTPSQVTGTLFNHSQAVAPQMWPRQLSRFGNQWRSAN